MGGGIISLCWAVLTFTIGGVLSTIFPRISEVLLLYLVFSRAFLIGFFEVLAAVVRREAGAVALRLTMGVVSVVFAIVMIATNIETSSPLTLLRPFAIFCVIIGITLLLVSFAVRSQLRKRVSAIA